MKKLMFTAAALCATVLVAGTANPLTSSKIVGYVNREGLEARNYYTPCFQKVDNTDVTIQDVQLSEDVEDMGADLQVLDDKRACIGEAYMWMTAEMAQNDYFKDLAVPEGMGAWVNTDFALPEIDSLQFGQVVQVTLPEGAYFKSCGQVCEDDAVVEGLAGCNFVGNPYPIEMSIQYLQCLGVGEGDAELQFIGSDRKCIGSVCQWVTSEIAEVAGAYEGAGAWLRDGGLAGDKLQPGEGVQIWLQNDGQITVISPIDL